MKHDDAGGSTYSVQLVQRCSERVRVRRQPGLWMLRRQQLNVGGQRLPRHLRLQRRKQRSLRPVRSRRLRSAQKRHRMLLRRHAAVPSRASDEILAARRLERRAIQDQRVLRAGHGYQARPTAHQSNRIGRTRCALTSTHQQISVHRCPTNFLSRVGRSMQPNVWYDPELRKWRCWYSTFTSCSKPKHLVHLVARPRVTVNPEEQNRHQCSVVINTTKTDLAPHYRSWCAVASPNGPILPHNHSSTNFHRTSTRHGVVGVTVNPTKKGRGYSEPRPKTRL